MTGPAPEHGERACYLRGCDRPECVAAHTAYGAQRTRMIAYGRWDPFTDAEPVRQHVRELVAAGLTYTAIETMAGVSAAIVWRLMDGAADRPPSIRIRREAAAAILAVSAEAVPSPDTRVDGTGTRRRLQALMARGWCPAALAAELGRYGSNVNRILSASLVRDSTRREVAALYDRLWNKPPPSGTKRDAAYAARAMQLAAANGWPPPQGWDDEDLDNPAAGPAKGWRRPERTLPAVVAEEAAELIRQGLSRPLVAERLGYASRQSLDRVAS